MDVREPQVAGTFYPGSKKALLQFLDLHIDKEATQIEAKAVLMPHAGYIYSGTTAALAISRVKIPGTVLLIGPNHTGLGASFSLMARGAWKTPLGTVEIDEALAGELLKSSNLLEDDDQAHRFEHSLEVEIPFLQYKRENVKIVPLSVGAENISNIRQAAEAIGNVFKEGKKKVLVVASSDMTHYESEASACKKDKYAINAMLALDADGLINAVGEHKISMCGYIPAFMMLIIAKHLGATKAELVDYRTSAEASGDKEQVVGYAGIIVT